MIDGSFNQGWNAGRREGREEGRHDTLLEVASELRDDAFRHATAKVRCERDGIKRLADTNLGAIVFLNVAAERLVFRALPWLSEYQKMTQGECSVKINRTSPPTNKE